MTEKTMRVLVVYEQIPESTTFAIVDVTKKQWSEIKAAHGVMVNVGDYTDEQYKANQRISDAFASNEDDCENKDYACVWKDEAITLELGQPIHAVGIKRVIVSGFML